MKPLIQNQQASWKQLESRWVRTTQIWQDEMSLEFMHKFWEPLEKENQNYRRALDKLVNILEEVEESIR